MFNAPGLPPNGDPRTPDIIVTPNVGVIYTGKQAKVAEHGGFANDDTNVIMLLSNPHFKPSTVISPVETMQVAPTILVGARTRSECAAGGADRRYASAAGSAIQQRRLEA